MNDPRPWLKSIELKPGECLQSVAIRLAPHGLVTVAEFLELGLGMDRRQLAALPERDDAIRKLALIGGFALEDLNSRGWRRTDRSIFALGREMPDDWFVTDRRRVAPGRLTKDQGSPWARMLWQVRPLPCDPETGERLIDRCQCGSLLTWANAETVCGCAKCGRDVRHQAVTTVPREIFDLGRELAGYFGVGCRPRLPEPFDRLSDRAIFAAMNWFGYFVALDKYLKPGAANALEGYRALKLWPASFDRAVAGTKGIKFLGRNERMGELILSIRRANEPEVETILLKRASERFGVPLPPAEAPKGRSLDAEEILRSKWKGVKFVYDKFSLPLSHFVISKKALLSRR
jgi:hypothetical protein